MTMWNVFLDCGLNGLQNAVKLREVDQLILFRKQWRDIAVKD